MRKNQSTAEKSCKKIIIIRYCRILGELGLHTVSILLFT